MKRKYQIKENYFDKIDTEEKAYFMGFFYADGYNSKNGSSLVISLNIKDIDILYRFSNMILGEEHVSIYDRGPKGKEAVFRINSKDLCHRFSELGCPNCKTYTLEFPKWIDDDLLRHFVRGYFDGDGSIILSSRQAKITSSKIFNSFLKEILISKFPNLVFCEEEESEKISSLKIYGYPSVLKFLYWIYDGSSIYLNRKYDKYLKFLSDVELMIEKMEKGTRGYPKRYLENYKWYSKVRKNTMTISETMQCNKCNNEYSLKEFRLRKNRGREYRVKVCIYCEREQKSRAEKKRYYKMSDEEKRIHHERAYVGGKKESYKLWRRKWQKDREEKNFSFKLKRRFSALLRFKLKEKSKCFVLDYSIEDLIKHLEGQFEPWMNWENYGVYRVDKWDDNDSSTWTWQIDHIVPVSKFKYNSEEDEDFKKCWALENLRPLSSKENLLKGAKIQ